MRQVLCVCAIQRVNQQDKIFKCLWTGYGSWGQEHQFVSRTATLLGFSCSTVSHVYQKWSTTQRTSSQLDTTVESIGVKWASIPVFLMFCTLSIATILRWFIVVSLLSWYLLVLGECCVFVAAILFIFCGDILYLLSLSPSLSLSLSLSLSPENPTLPLSFHLFSSANSFSSP